MDICFSGDYSNTKTELEQRTNLFWDYNSTDYYDLTYYLLKDSTAILNVLIEHIKKETKNPEFIPIITFMSFNEIKIYNIKYKRNEEYDYIVIHKNKIETPFGMLYIKNINTSDIKTDGFLQNIKLDKSKLIPNMVGTLRHGTYINGYRYKLERSYNYTVPIHIIKNIMQSLDIEIN